MIPFLSRTVPIPERLYDSTSGQPFERCVVCERDLLGGDVPYCIEQAVRQVGTLGARDTVFEYALCEPCGAVLWTALSGDSRARIEAFMAERFDVHARLGLLGGDADAERWLGTCALTGTPAAALDEYQIVAQCRGDRLVLSHLPCLLSGAALDGLAACLSARTKDELGGFVDRHLGPPPGLRQLLTERGVVLL